MHGYIPKLKGGGRGERKGGRGRKGKNGFNGIAQVCVCVCEGVFARGEGKIGWSEFGEE